jgi:hypothetical protein
MRPLIYQTILFLLIPAGVSAQVKGERFFAGSASFYNSSNKTETPNPQGGLYIDSYKSYDLDLVFDYGKFTRDNRAIQFGLISSTTYFDITNSGYDAEHTRDIQSWSYRMGAHFSYSTYFPVLPGLYGSVINDFAFTHSWSKSDNQGPYKVKADMLTYSLSPGVFYRFSPKFGLNLSLNLLSVNLLGVYGHEDPEDNYINLNVSADVSINNLYFGVIWFPAGSKKKVNPNEPH